MTDEPVGGEHATVIETHISWVFFVGDRAYKVKRPVAIDVLDLSTLEARRRACEQEVELNRRLAPDVYLGVAKLVDPDESIREYAVVMRRLDGNRQLARLVRDPDFDGSSTIDAITEVLVRFHQHADRSPVISEAGQVGTITALCEANTGMLRSLREQVDQHLVNRIEELQHRFLASCAAAFTDRVRNRCIVDGHGDLQAADIFIEADGPRILDCLEFSGELRHGDVLADVAFLAMDLEHLGRPDLSTHLMDQYRAASGDTWPTGLEDFWIAYRAQVRAKVSGIRGSQGDPEAFTASRSYLRLAARRLATAIPTMVIVGGLPGSGKSTVARGLQDHYGSHLFQSDVIRDELIPRVSGGASGFETGRYRPDRRAAVYRALLDRAEASLTHGHSVILDATWVRAVDRAAARAVAARMRASIVEIECRCDDDIAAERIAHRVRTVQPSDATAGIRARYAVMADRWPGATTIDSSSGTTAVLGSVINVVDEQRAAAASTAPSIGGER